MSDNNQLRLLTWIDVERVLKKATNLWRELPEGIVAVDCFFEGMDVYYSTNKTVVDNWLREIFKNKFLVSDSDRKIRLEIGDSDYQIELIESEDNRAEVRTERVVHPLWQEVAYLPKPVESHDSFINTDTETIDELSVVDSSIPQIAAFYSFKGGVARTTALMTYVTACFAENWQDKKKILVIDADLEAPGVTFWLDDAHRPTVSFIDFLEAVHYPPKGVDATLEYFTKELRKTSYSFGNLDTELFILPACRSLSDIQDMSIRPEHLVRNIENPFVVIDYLLAFGQKLEVDAIFIDLRAGLSELSSPFLFDKRIERYFISTVAPQSVQGTREVLERLYAYNVNIAQLVKPTVVLTMLTDELKQSQFYINAIETFETAYPTLQPLNEQVVWQELDFHNSLMSISSIDDALKRLIIALPLYSDALQWAKTLYSKTTYKNSEIKDRKDLVERLKQVCEQTLFAESGHLGTLLRIKALENLGKQFSQDIPNALVVGAKGSGKTFTYRQIVQNGSWETFLAKLGFESSKIQQAIAFPVLWSTNIQDTPDGEIKMAQNNVVSRFDNTILFTASQIQEKINHALQQPDTNWLQFWTKFIVEQFGFEQKTLSEFNAILAENQMKLVLLFDGIEDLFSDVNDVASRAAIEALLKLPDTLAELEDRHLGALVFCREDYVQSVIQQNAAQMVSRYDAFRLYWNVENFLRLAYLLGQVSGLFSKGISVEKANIEELKSSLEKLWGRKMGSEKSKEAYSARWVYTILADLNGNLQARDLVRFLKFAADKENERDKKAKVWNDRLLSPDAMRKAVQPCSKEKVEEAKKEIAALRSWIEKLKSINRADKRIPFSAEQVSLDAKMQIALQNLGIIYEDIDSKQSTERLYLPEIYRYGLDFEASTVGRPRTLALLKKNIGSIPL